MFRLGGGQDRNFQGVNVGIEVGDTNSAVGSDRYRSRPVTGPSSGVSYRVHHAQHCRIARLIGAARELQVILLAC